MLYWNTVSPLLRGVLEDLMQQPAFDPFRLVGGTALSLHLGHRMSIDIDLFSDEPYGSIDFQTINSYLAANYGYFYKSTHGLVGMGQSYLIGNTVDDNIKLDIYYTDPFLQPAQVEDGIRLATVEEIAAMKIDVVHRGGRKKDFWDLDEILESHSINDLLALHKLRHPYSHNEEKILQQLVDFEKADNDFDPICLKDKRWELIRYGLVEAVNHR